MPTNHPQHEREDAQGEEEKMDEETMAPADDLGALDLAEDEEQLGDAAGKPSNNPVAC